MAGAKTWGSRLEPYRHADDRRAVLEIAVTFVPFVVSWVATWALLSVSYPLALCAALISAFMLVRLFMIQHDCGHGAMFSKARLNDWVGRAISVITMTPYDYWRRAHALHHAGAGNLARRGIGDIQTLTVKEYEARSWWGKLQYRLYRHPLVLFGLGPSYVFIFLHRVVSGPLKGTPNPWASTMLTNLAIALVWAVMIYALGLWTFLLIELPIVIGGASIGVWLFYIQHQFDPTHWEQHENWQREDAALHGSSYYDLPKPMMWLTANIGIHHVHHLSSRIPYHRLPQVLKDFPALKSVGRLTFWQSLKCVRLALWDEETKQLISFREAKRRQAAG